uniref:Uncharacterized protein n=1 Tax=viral metagenome TaxID=1070528 RepID=A0A6C0D128_9ZZZZ
MAVLSFFDTGNVYEKLSPLSMDFPVTIEDVVYPSILHAILLPFLKNSHQRSILLSTRNISALTTHYNEWERKQFEETVATILNEGYQHLLSGDFQTQVYNVGRVLETMHQHKIDGKTNGYVDSSNLNVDVKRLLRDLLSELQHKSIYFHEMWDPLEVMGLNGTKTPVEGMNVVGRTLEALSYHNKRATQYESRETEIYYLHALILYFHHLFQSGEILWRFVGKPIQEIYEEDADFREFLTSQVSFSMIDFVEKEKVVRSFLSNAHPDSFLIEMECQFPGNIAIYYMKKYIQPRKEKLDQEWSSLVLSEFSLSITRETSPHLSEYETIQRTMENILHLSLAQRTHLYHEIIRLYENGKWVSEKLDTLRQERGKVLETIHQLSFITAPRVYKFVEPSVSIGDQLSNVKKGVFTDSFSLSPLLFLLDYRTLIFFTTKVSGCSIYFFFPSIFHYLYFRLFLFYSSPPDSDTDLHYIKLYSKLWKEGLPEEVEEALLSQKTRSVPKQWHDPQYFFDSETSEGHSILYNSLQTLILDRKGEMVSNVISRRIQQHPYLQHLLLTTSLLGWNGFRYISSLKDTFLGYDSPEKEQSFFAWQYHNVVGKSYDKVMEELLKHHEKTKQQFETLSSFVELEKHSFDIVNSQFELIQLFFEKTALYHDILHPNQSKISVEEVIVFTQHLFPFLFRLDALVVVPPPKKEMDRVLDAWSSEKGMTVLSTEAQEYVGRIWVKFWFKLNEKKIPQNAMSPSSTSSLPQNKEEMILFWTAWWNSFLSSFKGDGVKRLCTKSNLVKVLKLILPEKQCSIPNGMMEVGAKEWDCDQEALLKRIAKMKTPHVVDDFVCIQGKWVLKTSKTAKEYEANGPPPNTVLYLYSPLFKNSTDMLANLEEAFPSVRDKAALSRLSFVLYYCVLYSDPSLLSFFS